MPLDNKHKQNHVSILKVKKIGKHHFFESSYKVAGFPVFWLSWGIYNKVFWTIQFRRQSY